MPHESYYKNKKCCHFGFDGRWKKLLMDNVMEEKRQCSECWDWKEVRGMIENAWMLIPRPAMALRFIQQHLFFLFPLFLFLFLFFSLSLSLFFCFSQMRLFLLLWRVISTTTAPHISVFHTATELCYMIFANGVEFRRERLRV